MPAFVSRCATAVGALVLVLAATVGAQEAPTSAPADTQAARLDRLVESIRAAREDLEIAGLSYAVVDRNGVLRHGGFGYRDVERELPADSRTKYAIGSTTKAFTAALIGMLVDDGVMAWDEAVRTHLPEFRLSDPEADAAVTVRDLLCHRTGLMGTDLLWYAGKTSWDDMHPCIARAELRQPFREVWQYQNVCFLAAGLASANAAGTDWDGLLRTRILEPLGMNDVNTDITDLEGDDDAALGYTRKDDAWKVLPRRNLNGIKPAGAINAHVLDMAKWMRFLLNGGVHDGARLLEPTTIETMWTAQIEIGGGLGYGLGWALGTQDGHRVVEHSGGIDGYSAHVVLLPDDGLGMVMLTNANQSAISGMGKGLLIQAMCAPEPGDAPATAEDLTAYTGIYQADFGPFDDVDFTVTEKDGVLSVNVPGQRDYALAPPNEDGRRPFAITDTIAVEFESDADGVPVVLVMHQGGLRFECPRRGVEIVDARPTDLETARRHIGIYKSDADGDAVEVLARNNRLAIDVPGQMIFDLYPPDEEGRWVFRATDAIAVSFEGDALTIHQGETAQRYVRAAPAGLPTIDEVMAIMRDQRGGPAYEQIICMHWNGAVTFVNQGMTGTIAMTLAGYDRIYNRTDLGVFGEVEYGVDGPDAWSQSSFAPYTPLEDKLRVQQRLEGPATLLAPWREQFESGRVLRMEEIDGRQMTVVELTPEDLPARTIWIDALNGQVHRAQFTLVGETGAGRPVVVEYSDYRDVAGCTLPFAQTIRDDAFGTVHITMDAPELNPVLENEPWGAPHSRWDETP